MDLDPDPYKIITGPDPEGPETSGSGTLNPAVGFLLSSEYTACVLLISE